MSGPGADDCATHCGRACFTVRADETDRRATPHPAVAPR